MAANAAQLFLLSDHLKLSLLERQRAASLNLEPSSQDAEISRSLESFRDGLEALEAQGRDAECVYPNGSNGQDSADRRTNSPLQGAGTQVSELRKQYDVLRQQFDGTNTATSATIAQPNDTKLSSDFSKAQSARPSKSVRFQDDPAAQDPNRAALFPYRDEPDPDQAPDHRHLDNQQIHQYHSQVIQDQDEQLDRLGASISRQRDLSINIGDELDEQAQILDDVDQGVDRHHTQIERARNRVGKIARKAKDNLSLTIIMSLIIILILLIVITK